MDQTYDDFVQDFADRLDDIRRADWRQFALALSDLLLLIDTSVQSENVVRSLGARVDFDTWYADCQKTVGGMVGSGRLNWSPDRTERLAQQLGLVRLLSSSDNEIAEFSSSFSWAGANLNDNKRKIVDELIEPFARDLLRYIDRSRQSAPTIPASDRVVPVNHNSLEIQDLEGRLGELETAMETSNSLKHEPDFDRNLAEISATRRLLTAATVRLSALGALLLPALKWLGEKAADHAIGLLITAIAALVATAFGLTIPGLH